MKKRWVNSFTVSLAVAFLSLGLYFLDLDFFNLLELRAFDFKTASRGVRPVSGRVVIVAVDEKSLRQEGRWPWARSRLAQLVDRFSESGAAAIGIDILFPEPDRRLTLGELNAQIEAGHLPGKGAPGLKHWLEMQSQGDGRLAQSLLKSERSVLGYFVFSNREQAGESARPIDARQLELLDFSQYPVVQMEADGERPSGLRSMYAVGLSLPELMNSANGSGYVSFIPQKDGVVRWVPLVQAYRDYLFPPLSLQLLREATRLNLVLRLTARQVAEVRLGDRAIPVSPLGDYLVNYYGPAQTFRHYSAVDVLNGAVSESELRDKIVLVGTTAVAIHDMHTIPYGPLYPGVEVHANIIENILNDDFLRRPAWTRWLDVATILGTGLILGWGSVRFRAFGTAILLAVLFGGYLAADYLLFVRKGLWVNTVYPVFSQLLVYFGITLYRFTFEEREKRFIKSAFSQYLAPTVVDRLVEDPSLLRLGGERKEITAFFSDVAGFSTIAEKLSAEELVDLLNHYLTEMTEIILHLEGTVDKYEGDAIIAFFGAPVPTVDHARRTCLAALDMQKRLAQLRLQWREEGRPELHMRIGINTGPAVVGNLGSKNRMDYTMMGDTVNLAARLEGVNKQYKTMTLISQFTYEQVASDIEARELDMIRVVGKSQPVKIYELLGRRGELEEIHRRILPLFREGLEHYRARRWAEGIRSFEAVLAIHAEDGPSLTYLERCRAFRAEPPPADWDGVFSMSSK